MKNDLLTIKEFAKKTNVSVQSIYQRINKKNDVIHNYIVTKDNKKYIKENAIEEIYKKNTAETETGKTANIEIIEFLKQQIIEKDKQIAEKDKQINEITQALVQQQQLNAIDKQRIELIETKRKKPRFNIFKKRGTIQEKE